MTTTEHTNTTMIKIPEMCSQMSSDHVSTSMSVETIQSSSDESMSGDEILSDVVDIHTNSELPTGILFDITSTDKTTFKKDCMFKFIHDNPRSTSIPDKYLNGYVTEYNYNGQTPLMYAVILNNVDLVKLLLKHDVGKMDEFNKSALDYANETFHKLKAMNESEKITPEIYSINHIINILSEYECY